MNDKTLMKTTLTLALFTLMASDAYAMAPRDVDDLVGARASSGETELEHRGYHYRKTIKTSKSSIGYWWNPRKQACIAGTTTDGRYKAIMAQPEAVCKNGDRDSGRHHGDRYGDDRDRWGGAGRRTPHIRKADDGNIAVDMGGCNVLFNRRGGILNQGASCSRHDVREARDAFDRYKREQGAPANAEAPPGGFRGNDTARTVTCKSEDYKYQFCRRSIGSHTHVRIERRLSKTHCNEGESWGYDADGVWVDKGCSAIFEFR